MQVAANVLFTHVKATPTQQGVFDEDLVNIPHYIDVYSVATCSQCESIFLVESSFVELPGEFSTPTGERILYPPTREISMDGLPASIARQYSSATRSFRFGLYEPCVIMCRKCLEALCKELGTKKGNLKARLVDLHNNGQIDQKLLTWADELRLIGNDAAHDLDIVIEQVDAQDALEFVEAILMYTFSLTRKFEKFRKRRASKPQG